MELMLNEIDFLKKLKSEIVYVENEVAFYMIDERIKQLERKTQSRSKASEVKK